LAAAIAADIDELDPDYMRTVAPKPQDIDLREAIRINGGKIQGLGFETIRKILRSRPQNGPNSANRSDISIS
jgi:hypothetical protein